jgi:uncharacterized protein (DUF2384 family)
LTDIEKKKPEQTGSEQESPRTQRFRPRQSGPRLTADAAERQGRIVRLAFASFGGRDGAIAFLNARHEALGGRPVELAVASETGCAAVERAIAEHTANP